MNTPINWKTPALIVAIIFAVAIFIFWPATYLVNKKIESNCAKKNLKVMVAGPYDSKPYPYGGAWPVVVVVSGYIAKTKADNDFATAARESIGTGNAELRKKLELKKDMFIWADTDRDAAALKLKYPKAAYIYLRSRGDDVFSSCGGYMIGKQRTYFSNGDKDIANNNMCNMTAAFFTPRIDKDTSKLLPSYIYVCAEKLKQSRELLVSGCASAFKKISLVQAVLHEYYHPALFGEGHSACGSGIMKSRSSRGELSQYEVDWLKKHIVPGLRRAGF